MIVSIVFNLISFYQQLYYNLYAAVFLVDTKYLAFDVK
jgi:hypothetical protein